MTTFQSIKNKIALIALIFPPLCYAQDGEKLQFKANEDFGNLEKITPAGFIAGAISIALTITIVVFFFILIIGGYRWITSSGDEKKLVIARASITNGLIGLLIIFSSWVIMGILGSVFGIDVLKLTIPSFINPT